nr:bifunctional adenosylcobinamide kinase/adenosylcobinamide-phosphate guanylyltransferase [Aestuariivita sp.]
MLPKLTLMIGGAASGKSRLAERLAETHAKTKIYVASAQVFDAEMAAKVALHKTRRSVGWDTIEAPLDVASALHDARGDVVLFDCATLWLSNHMLSETSDLPRAEADLLAAIANCAPPVIVVSNEVGEGIVPENTLARRFREAQGRLNIRLAAEANLVIKVTAGLPQVLKGLMP